MMNPQRFLGHVAALLLITVASHAGAPRYNTWTAQTNNDASFVGELRKLIDEAEQARAADRAFLRDLRDLADRFDNPWQRRLLFEDFRDGDYLSNPSWQIIDGHFEIRAGHGLVATGAPATTAAETATQKKSDEDFGRDLAFALLGQMLNPENKNNNTAPAPGPEELARGALYTTLSISNAFSVQAIIDNLNTGTMAQIELFQDAPDKAGYRLTLTREHDLHVELQRFSRRGTATVDQVSVSHLTDDRLSFGWTRTSQGHIVVKLGKQVLIDTTDRSFRDAFQGIAYRASGNDIALRELSVDGQ